MKLVDGRSVRRGDRLAGSGFLFGGVCLALLFRRNHADLPRLYMADLVGAGAGVLAAVWLMNGIGTPSATFFCSVPVLVAALLACRGWWKVVPVASGRLHGRPVHASGTRCSNASGPNAGR